MKRYPHEATFKAFDFDCMLIATRPEDLLPAVETVVSELSRVAAVTCLDLPSSEASRLTRLAQHADVTAPVSDVMIDYLSAALWSADLTDGLLRPTSEVAGRAESQSHWERIEIGDGNVTLPRGCVLDLAATAPAHAADLLVKQLTNESAGGGFLVSVCGDLAVAGECPEGGWEVPVTAPNGKTVQLVSTTHAALARSSQHVLNGAMASNDKTASVWRQVTVAAATALEANAWASASVLLGELAPAWLSNRGVPARLERRTGTTRFTGGWPRPSLIAA